MSGPTTISGDIATTSKFNVPSFDMTNLPNETGIESTDPDLDSDGAVLEDETEVDLGMLEAFSQADRRRFGKSVQHN
jgi:hypothetical protein